MTWYVNGIITLFLKTNKYGRNGHGRETCRWMGGNDMADRRADIWEELTLERDWQAYVWVELQNRETGLRIGGMDMAEGLAKVWIKLIYLSLLQGGETGLSMDELCVDSV